MNSSAHCFRIRNIPVIAIAAVVATLCLGAPVALAQDTAENAYDNDAIPDFTSAYAPENAYDDDAMSDIASTYAAENPYGAAHAIRAASDAAEPSPVDDAIVLEISGIEPQAESGDLAYAIKDSTGAYGAGAYVTGLASGSTATTITVPAQLGGYDVVAISLAGCKLTSLDVNACSALKYLNCSDNELDSLAVSKNAALEYLICSNNWLESFTIRKNTALEYLACSNNDLYSLDVSGNIALRYLNCSDNWLASLDVSNNTALSKLYCYDNFISDTSALTSAFGSEAHVVLPQKCRVTADPGGFTAYTGQPVSYSGLVTVRDLSGNVISDPTLAYTYYVDELYTQKTTPGNSGSMAEGTAPANPGRWYVSVTCAESGTAYGTDSAYTQYCITLTDAGTGLAYYTQDASGTYGAGVYVVGHTGTSKDVAVPKQIDGKDVVSVDLSSLSLDSLDVSACTGLLCLECQGDGLTSLDVSSNTALERLSCGNNNLGNLDLGNNAALTELFCLNDDLSTLDVSSNTALEYFYCSNNQLSDLNVDKNTALVYLECYNNQLTSLNVDKNTALKLLYCNKNQLTSLDVSQNTEMNNFVCGDNQLASIDVGSLVKLESFTCRGNQLTSLDVSSNVALEYLNCSYNRLISLDVSNNALLASLRCYNNYIDDTSDLTAAFGINRHVVLPQSSIIELQSHRVGYYSGSPIPYDWTVKVYNISGDLVANPTLTYTYYVDKACTQKTTPGNSGAASEGAAPANAGRWYVKVSCAESGTDYGASTASVGYVIANVDSSGIAYLARDASGGYGKGAYVLGYTGNSTSLAVPATIAGEDVVYIDVSYLDIESLDVSACTQLQYLSCQDDKLTSLDVSKNKALKVLYCSANQLASLDVSANTALASFNCANNDISSLDLSNNTALTYVHCSNDRLTSLDVSKNTALRQLYCSNNQLTTLDVSKNTALEQFDCDGNQLGSLDTSKNTALMQLYCNNNQLDSLDLGSNAALKALYCNNNQLSTLDLGSNAALKLLYCNNNRLSLLDLGNNTALNALGCDGNQLDSLDVSKSTALQYLSCADNAVTSLDVTANKTLAYLECDGNWISTLDVTANKTLGWLYCCRNSITALDVSANPKLRILRCNDNKLSSLDVGANAKLEYLDCSGNGIASLDIDANPNLATLRCQQNLIADTTALEGWLDAHAGQVLPQNGSRLARIFGESRYDTMARIVQSGNEVWDYTIVVATGTNFPDALAASALAGLYRTHVVLIDGSLSSPENTKALSEIERVDADDVIIVGGESAVSSGIADALSSDAIGLNVTRVSGDDRIATALAIYEAGKTVHHVDACENSTSTTGWGKTVIIASGGGTDNTKFADALSVSPLAYSASFPVLLADADGNLADEVKTAITSGGFEHAIIVGGTAVVSADSESWLSAKLGDGQVVRLGGADRYETSGLIADFSSGQGAYASYPAKFGYRALGYAFPGIATGANFPDALAGAAACGLNNSVLLLSDASGASCTGRLSANKSSVRYASVFGGTSAVSTNAYATIAAALK